MFIIIQNMIDQSNDENLVSKAFVSLDWNCIDP